MAVLDTIVEVKITNILNVESINSRETVVSNYVCPPKSAHIDDFLNECKTNRLKSELLSFWGRHPNASFTWNAIYYAMDFSKSDVINTLDCFMERGVIETRMINEYMFYSLANNENVRYLITQAWPDEIHRHLSKLY
ncbi:MAG: hypothetical protein NTV30_03345 [Chloroflexi bacterium]|nr:hypothetical protein [Chloroflexota bacterium]